MKLLILFTVVLAALTARAATANLIYDTTARVVLPTNLFLKNQIITNSLISGTAVNLTGSLTNVTIDGTHIADVKTAFAATLQDLLTEASPGEAKLAYVLGDDSGAPGTRGTYRFDPTLATAADNVTIWEAQDAPALGRWVRLSAGDNYQMSVDTLDDALAIEPAYLAASLNPTNTVKLTVKTRARKTLGKGGAASYYYSATAPATTNTGTIVAYGSGYLLSDGVDGVVTPQMFGALGDGTTDDTQAFQDAINYAELVGIKVFVPGGHTYLASTLTVTKCELYGVRNQQERVTTGNSIILQTASPTNHLIVVGTSGNAKPNIHDLTLVGRGDVSTPDKRAITSVTSRLVFGVSTNYTPTLANAPGYHAQVAMLYTSEDRYMGSAVVASIATVGAECIVTLDPEWDNFATVAASGYLLDTNCKVVFSPILTRGASTFANPALAGYCAIYVSSGLSGRLADLTIAKFHSGIYVGSESTPYQFLAGTIKINYAEFAGFASAAPTMNADMIGQGSIVIAGPYIRPAADLVTYPTETVVLTNSLARNTTFAFYNPFSLSRIADIRTDQCVVAYYTAREISNSIGYFLADNCLRYGIVSEGGYYDSISGQGSSMGDVNVRLWLLSTNGTAAYFTNKSAIKMTSTTFRNELALTSLSIADSVTGPGTFDWAFDISGTNHNLSIGAKLGDLSGAAALYRSTTYPVRWLSPYDNTTAAATVTGWYNPSGTSVAYAAAASDVLSLGADDIWIQSDYTRLGANAPAPDGIHAVYGWPALAGNGVNAVGFFLRPELSATATAAFQAVRLRADIGSGVIQPIANGLVVMNAAGSGTLTNSAGATLIEQTKGVSGNANLRLAADPAAGWFGNLNIYSLSTRSNYWAGDDLFADGKGVVFENGSYLKGSTNSFTGSLKVAGKTVLTQPTTEVLSYSGTDVSVTASKGPDQSSSLVCTNSFTLLFLSVTDNDSGTILVYPAATNCIATLTSPAYGPSGATLTITGGTGGTNHTVIAWKATQLSSTNIISVNAVNYYR